MPSSPLYRPTDLKANVPDLYYVVKLPPFEGSTTNRRPQPYHGRTGSHKANTFQRRRIAWTGSHKGPIPTSTSSPAPTIHGLGGPLRRIVSRPVYTFKAYISGICFTRQWMNAVGFCQGIERSGGPGSASFARLRRQRGLPGAARMLR